LAKRESMPANVLREGLSAEDLSPQRFTDRAAP